MHTLLSLLASFSLAVTTASAGWSTSDVVTVVPHPSPPPPLPLPVSISTSTIEDTFIYTCPPVPTVFLSVTQYISVPVTVTATAWATDTTTASYFNTATESFTDTATATAIELFTDTTTASFTNTTTASYTETTTQPITIFQTIISTTILTTTETVTETSTTVSPSPTTATATEELLIETYTSQVTSITLCPTRTANPTFTALGPLPTDWTWGCPPGWLCKPTRQNCNFEAGIPSENFYCAPNECIPAQALPEPLPTWSNDIYGNVTPTTNQGLQIQAIDDYFNMDPTQFGLSYQIFVVNEVFTVTSTTIIPPSPTVAARQAETSVPGACYPWCNNCLLEAQARGKTSALCVPGSAFEVSLGQCDQCIDVHKSDGSGSFVQIAPQFQQFLDYCAQFATVVLTTSVTETATNSHGTTYTSVSLELSTTVTPKSLVTTSTSTSTASHGSFTIVVSTTETASPTPIPTSTTALSTKTVPTSSGTSPVSESSSVIVTSSSSTETLPVIITTTTATSPSPSSNSTSKSLSLSSSVSPLLSSPQSQPTSESPYTTTITASTTLPSLTTITGTQWSQITIILPLPENSTTTIYGSNLTTGATLVLPVSSTLSLYTTTEPITPGNSGSSSGNSKSIPVVSTDPAKSQSTSSSSPSPSPSSPPVAPSVFSGDASGLKCTLGDLYFRTLMVGLVVAVAAAAVVL